MATLDLHDETLDASHGPTRLLLALEYWKNQALEARIERDELLAALEPFATAFKPAAEQLRKYGASDVMLTHLDRNTVTPTMTMGDFRRAFEAVTGTKCHGQQEKQAETETTVPALVFFPAGSLGEEVEP